MRDLGPVLDKMLNLIPAEETQLRTKIERIQLAYTAKPEPFWWSITAQVLDEEMPRFNWVEQLWRTFNPRIHGAPDE